MKSVSSKNNSFIFSTLIHFIQQEKNSPPLPPPHHQEKTSTYFIQMQLHLTAGFDGGRFATDLSDFAENADGAVGELLEVGSGDTGSGFGHDGCCLRDGVVVDGLLMVLFLLLMFSLF